jgi:hypothetical protein
MNRKRISRGFVYLLLVGIVAMLWFLWHSGHYVDRYNRVHRTTYEKTSASRLQTLARQATAIANTRDDTNSFIFARITATIPQWVQDLDPNTVIINRDNVDIELGISPRYGFFFERSETNSNLWFIMRYDGTNKIRVGTYQQGGAEMLP